MASSGGDRNRQQEKQPAFLTAPLNRFFIPRPFPEHLSPLDRAPDERTGPILSGLGAYLTGLKQMSATPLTDVHMSPSERRQERLKEKKLRSEERLNAALAQWHPKENPNATGDPFKTLFLGRLHYDIDEKQLKKEFERYGKVVSVRLIKDAQGKSRGYAFVEFEREKACKEAYDEEDGRKLEGRRMVVDVERGRTVKGWRPRRLGGGLGGTRLGEASINVKDSGRDPRAQPNPRKRIRSRSRSSERPSIRSRESRPRDGHDKHVRRSSRSPRRHPSRSPRRSSPSHRRHRSPERFEDRRRYEDTRSSSSRGGRSDSSYDASMASHHPPPRPTHGQGNAYHHGETPSPYEEYHRLPRPPLNHFTSYSNARPSY